MTSSARDHDIYAPHRYVTSHICARCGFARTEAAPGLHRRPYGASDYDQPHPFAPSSLCARCGLERGNTNVHLS